jgi:hypothetical protein
MDFNNINYKEIDDYKQQEKDPELFIRHFQCTLDKESGKMVKDEIGEFVISTAAFYALKMKSEYYYKKNRKNKAILTILVILLKIAIGANLLSAIYFFFIK